MRVRNEHWQIIVESSEKNPEIITNKFNGIEGKAKGHALWQTLSHKLNSLGFGEKSVEEWRRALVDWKSKTKAKAAKIKKEMEQTGGGPPNYIPLSDLESRLIDIMGKKAIDGDEVHELGFGKVTVLTMIPSKNEAQTSKLEHNYCHTVENQTPALSKDSTVTTVPTTKTLKRPFSDTRQVNRRVRQRQNEGLSQKLLNINEESLQVLTQISKNTESMANSLVTLTAVFKQHLNK